MSTLADEVAIENAKASLRNAREWLDYRRGTGNWKPLTFWHVFWSSPLSCGPSFPPRPPAPGEIESAENVLREKGITE